VYRSIDELQSDLDVWIHAYNEARPHQGRWCFGKTPMQTFLDPFAFGAHALIELSRSIGHELCDCGPARGLPPQS